ncbi:hypothetical protein ACA910_007550 [Epithemia clementina (nom. ined.)]
MLTSSTNNNNNSNNTPTPTPTSTTVTSTSSSPTVVVSTTTTIKTFKKIPKPQPVVEKKKPTPLENLHMVNNHQYSKQQRRRREWRAAVRQVWQRYQGHVPNVLTALRVALLPVIVASFYRGPHEWSATAWWGLAAATDGLDGWWARKFDAQTRFGAFLDPVADKLTVCTCLILLTAHSSSSSLPVTLCTLLIVAREVAISALREWMATTATTTNPVVAVSWQGKAKTAVTFVTLPFWLLSVGAARWPSASGGRLHRWALTRTWHVLSLVLLYASTLLTWTSAMAYFRAAAPYLLASSTESSSSNISNLAASTTPTPLTTKLQFTNLARPSSSSSSSTVSIRNNNDDDQIKRSSSIDKDKESLPQEE